MLAAACLSRAVGAAPPAAPPRVASFGICADQMVLLMARRDRIASVSADAAGPLSVFADRARGLPTNRGGAEDVLASGATVLVTSSPLDRQSAAALAKFGVRVVDVPPADDWPDIETMTRTVAAAIGEPGRGRAVIADMRRRLAILRPRTPRSTWPTVVYYRPDGGGAGRGTFVDASLAAAGLRNLQAEDGPAGWSGMPVERTVMRPPDVFAVSYFDTNRNGLAVLRRNPVLWGAARRRPVIDVPGRYWNCGSPLLVDAVAALARASARYRHARRAP